jgi:hypothetical protein
MMSLKAYLEDIRPSAESTVYVNGDPPCRGFNAFRQCFQSRCNGIQLPSAVIRDDDAVYAVVDRKDDVFCRIYCQRAADSATRYP